MSLRQLGFHRLRLKCFFIDNGSMDKHKLIYYFLFVHKVSILFIVQ